MLFGIVSHQCIINYSCFPSRCIHRDEHQIWNISYDRRWQLRKIKLDPQHVAFLQMQSQHSKRFSPENCQVYRPYCLNCATSVQSSCSGYCLTTEYQEIRQQAGIPVTYHHKKKWLNQPESSILTPLSRRRLA
uniref:Uncharacterized protein n=1 Tax=Arion vulgaris TaxID=1028688 RepID=A0A0B7BF18_9EUPU